MSSLLSSASNIFYGFITGFADSLTGIWTGIRKTHTQNEKLNKKTQKHQKSSNTVSSARQTPIVFRRLLECWFFNLVVLVLSILIFNSLFLPYMYKLMIYIFNRESKVEEVWSRLESILYGLFAALWVLPLFVLSRFVNAYWFQDIAECTFRGKSQSVRSVSSFIADTLFSLIIELLILIQAFMVSKLMYIGQLASIFHLSLLYSLYSFEYKWFNHGK